MGSRRCRWMEAAGGGQEAETSELPLLLSARCHQHRLQPAPAALIAPRHFGAAGTTGSEPGSTLGCLGALQPRVLPWNRAGRGNGHSLLLLPPRLARASSSVLSAGRGCDEAGGRTPCPLGRPRGAGDTDVLRSNSGIPNISSQIKVTPGRGGGGGQKYQDVPGQAWEPESGVKQAESVQGTLHGSCRAQGEPPGCLP